MNNEDVLIMIPLLEDIQVEETFSPSSGKTQAVVGSIPLTMDQITDLVKGFPKFGLETIELHVKGAVKAGGATQLLIGFSGEAGIKLVLKREKTE